MGRYHQTLQHGYLGKMQALASEVEIRVLLLHRQIHDGLFRIVASAETPVGVDPLGAVGNEVAQLANLPPATWDGWFSLR